MGASDKVAIKTKTAKGKVKEPVVEAANGKQAPTTVPEKAKTAVAKPVIKTAVAKPAKAAVAKPVVKAKPAAKAAVVKAAVKAAVVKAAAKVKDRPKK
jgi:hypothetical protein